MTDLGWPVWLALYDRLAAEINTPVYVMVPEGAAYPYIARDSLVAAGEDWLTLDRQNWTLRLSVWSTQRGNKEVLDINAAVYAALHRHRLVLSTGHAYRCSVDNTQEKTDADGKTSMGQITIRIRTHN